MLSTTPQFKKMNMSTCIMMMLIVVVKQVTARPEIKTGMRHKHLQIEGEYWEPFLMWECPGYGLDWEEDCPGERTYLGIMWDLLLFMQHSRKFSFTLVHEADYEWGICHSINNCTGMVGMVNRGEVDLALGSTST